MGEKVKIMQLFGHKCLFPHNLIEASNQKKLLTKVLKLTNLNQHTEEKVKIMQSFGHKCSFCQNLNKASTPKISLTKVLNAHYPK